MNSITKLVSRCATQHVSRKLLQSTETSVFKKYTTNSNQLENFSSNKRVAVKLLGVTGTLTALYTLWVKNVIDSDSEGDKVKRDSIIDMAVGMVALWALVTGRHALSIYQSQLLPKRSFSVILGPTLILFSLQTLHNAYVYKKFLNKSKRENFEYEFNQINTMPNEIKLTMSSIMAKVDDIDVNSVSKSELQNIKNQIDTIKNKKKRNASRISEFKKILHSNQDLEWPDSHDAENVYEFSLKVTKVAYLKIANCFKNLYARLP